MISCFVTGLIMLWAAALPICAFGSGQVSTDSAISKDGLRHIMPGDRAALVQAAKDKNAGILVADDTGTVLFSQNPDTPMVPASILKILTSLAALTHLGLDYRFVTLAAHDPVTHTLYVKGQGDPLFVSEAILSFCRRVKEKTGITRIKKIVVDQSYFAADIQIPGTGRSLNPYDATIGALCANFNTISFTRDAAAQTYVSAEPQTPLLDIFKEQIKKTGQNQGRILLEKQVRPLYPGLLMAHFFTTLGVDVSGPVETGPFAGQEDGTISGPTDRTTAGQHDGTEVSQKSGTAKRPDASNRLDVPKRPDIPKRPIVPKIDILGLTSPYCLEQIIQKLLSYSNNFMANQVMLALGARQFGPPATLDKGVAVLIDFAEKNLGWEQVQLAEGSGLSRKNRVTPAQMGALLEAFMPHHRLLKRTGSQYYKTGTLSDVKTRAGYFEGKDNRLYPFVIMQKR